MMNTSIYTKMLLLAAGMSVFYMASASAATIVQPISVTGPVSASIREVGSIDYLINGVGFGVTSVLDNGVEVPGTLPIHTATYNDGLRWFTSELTPSSELIFDLGGVQDALTSVILYNYAEGEHSYRGVGSLDVWTSTTGLLGSYSLAETGMAFNLDPAGAGQIVDFSSELSAGISHIMFTNMVNLSSGTDNIIGINEVRFVAVPEPGTYALLAGLTGLVFVMVRRRR